MKKFLSPNKSVEKGSVNPVSKKDSGVVIDDVGGLFSGLFDDLPVERRLGVFPIFADGEGISPSRLGVSRVEGLRNDFPGGADDDALPLFFA